MRNSSIYRSNLSDEKVAFLAEVKKEKELNKEDNTPKAYKRQNNEPEKEQELDVLWQDFKSNLKEDRSPFIFMILSFIAGAVCMFLLNSAYSISSNLFTGKTNQNDINKPVIERKMPAQNKIQKTNSSIDVVPTQVAETDSAAPSEERYIVKPGDSMGSITLRFYGKYDPAKIDKIMQINNLDSERKLKVGQELIIPLD